jgi:hypothetical protein
MPVLNLAGQVFIIVGQVLGANRQAGRGKSIQTSCRTIAMTPKIKSTAPDHCNAVPTMSGRYN